MQDVIDQQNIIKKDDLIDIDADCDDEDDEEQEDDEYGQDDDEDDDEDEDDDDLDDMDKPPQKTNEQQTKLGSNLTDMLINLYNGKPTIEFQDHYATIAQIIETQKRLQQQNKGPEITSDALFELFCQKIDSIVGTVKDKLHEDAKKDGLIVVYKQENATVTNGQTKKSINEIIVAKDYKDFQPKFDEILSAVGDYFELFKNNTNKLEDLWLQLLEFLKLKNHSQYQVFKRTHYSVYIRKVIKFNIIQKIVEEAQRHLGTPTASDGLANYIEKIREIELQSQFLPDSYESFKRRSYIDVDLNHHTELQIKNEREQLRKRKEQQDLAKQRTFKPQSDSKIQQHSVCSDNYSDCQQYEQHKKQTSAGCCMCRCIARNHLFQHYQNGGVIVKQRQRKMRKEVSSEPLQELVPVGDEQVYKKDLDDLIDYIMQPKNQAAPENQEKKKAKKKKGKGSGEREESNEVGGVTPSISQVQQVRKESKQEAVQEAKSVSKAQSLSDEQFESSMRDFSMRLDELCNEAVKQHAKKLRPNYNETWVVSLQTQLQLIEKQRDVKK